MLWRIYRAIKNIFGPETIAFFGFATVAIMAYIQGHPYIALIVFVIGLIFIILSAYNSYTHRSTELIDKYEERFFVRMKTERKWAAKYLLEEHQYDDELAFILDYFEAPIGEKMFSKIIMDNQVYEYFRHWIIMYYLAAQRYIENYQEKDDAGSWTRLKPLYDRMIQIKKEQCEKELRRKCTDQDVIPSPEKLKEYLQQEARLK
jgi:hypothetical protein